MPNLRITAHDQSFAIEGVNTLEFDKIMPIFETWLAGVTPLERVNLIEALNKETDKVTQVAAELNTVATDMDNTAQ